MDILDDKGRAKPHLGFIIKASAFPVKRRKGDVGSIKYAYKLLSETRLLNFPGVPG